MLVNAEVWNAKFLAMFLKDKPQLIYADDWTCKTECAEKYSYMWSDCLTLPMHDETKVFVFLFCICQLEPNTETILALVFLL